MKRSFRYHPVGGEHIESESYNAYKVRELRNRAFGWFGKQCAKCGKRSRSKKDFVVHHRHYRTLGYEKREDVVVLCEACHDDIHARSKRKQLTAADAPFVDPEWAESLK